MPPHRVRTVLETVTSAVVAVTLLERELAALAVQTRALVKAIFRKS